MIQYLIEKSFTVKLHVANPVVDPNTEASLECCHLSQGTNKDPWTTSIANELGRLLNDIETRMKIGTNTIKFRPKSAIPKRKSSHMAK